MEKRYETRSGDLFVRSWARVRRVSHILFVFIIIIDSMCIIALLLCYLQTVGIRLSVIKHFVNLAIPSDTAVIV